ncbi:hypothetical protein D3C87_1477990 [compost metagenome]
MGGIHEGAGQRRLHTRQADIQACLEEEGVIGLAQIDFGRDADVSRQAHFQRQRRLAQRADETRRPAGAQQLLRVGAATGRARRRQLDVQAPVVTARLALTAAGSDSFAGVQHGIDLIDHEGVPARVELRPAHFFTFMYTVCVLPPAVVYRCVVSRAPNTDRYKSTAVHSTPECLLPGC